METSIRIVWDGTAPGLKDHRLSLGAFGPSLIALVVALRRIASGIVKDALHDPAYGSRGGKLAKEAALIDVQIADLGEGSVDATLRCTYENPDPQLMIFNDLTQRSAAEFMEALDAESRGIPRNAIVRRFFKRLPPGVTSQRYSLYENGVEVRSVSIGEVSLVETTGPTSHFVEIEGQITGVGFEPGRLEVRFKNADDHAVTCGATVAQVEKALQLRGGDVRALALRTPKRTRLLWVRPAGDAYQPLPRAAQNEHLLARWHEVLERLAQ